MSQKTSKRFSRIKKINWVQDPDMRDYGKEPHFVEKNKKATEFLLKHGLPNVVNGNAKK